jgi:hypothetical protein
MGACGSSNSKYVKYKKKKNKNDWEGGNNLDQKITPSNQTAVVNTVTLMNQKKDEEEVRKKQKEKDRTKIYKDTSAPNQKRNSQILKREPQEVDDDFIEENYYISNIHTYCRGGLLTF